MLVYNYSRFSRSDCIAYTSAFELFSRYYSDGGPKHGENLFLYRIRIEA